MATSAKIKLTKQRGALARAYGRSLKDFEDEKPLNGAERTLIERARRGEVAPIGREVPKDGDKDKDAKTIRAGLVRFLALGGDSETAVHEQGVQVQGAFIDGDLDLEGCTLVGDLLLWHCELAGTLTLGGALTRSVSLEGSKCRDITADGAEIAGYLLLRSGFVAQGAVRLLNADIKSNLDCSGGRFEGQDEAGIALNCDGIQVRGGIFLNKGFLAQGVVRLLGADIKQNLECDGGRIAGQDEDGDALVCDGIQIGGSISFRRGFEAQGTVRLVGAVIQADLVCIGGVFGAMTKVATADGGEKLQETAGQLAPTLTPLTLARATIHGTLWLGGAIPTPEFHGGVDLTGAKICRIIDWVAEDAERRAPDPTLRGGGDSPAFLRLDGLSYDRFGEPTDLNAKARIAFLRLQDEYDLGEGFKPQPWMQMIKVLRESGHTEAARDVSIAFEEERRKAGQFRWLTAILHRMYGLLVGYGHRPMLLARITISVWLVCGAIFDTAAEFGVMAPTNPRVYEGRQYSACRPESLGNWVACKAPYEYTTFNSVIYSLDLILPLVDLQQEKDWAPMITQPCASVIEIGNFIGICRHAWVDAFSDPHSMPEVGYWPFGFFVWTVMWFEILFGWIAGLLFVAVISGLVKKE